MSIPTAVTAERFDRYVRAGNATEARDRKTELAWAVDATVRALRDLHEAGVPAADVLDAAKGLHDAISNADHKLNMAIDAAGQAFDDLDLTELDDFIKRVA